MFLPRLFRPLLLAFGLFGLVLPPLFYFWIHANSVRYLWVIAQDPPCAFMGGGPYQLVVLGIVPWLFTAMGIGLFLVSHRWVPPVRGAWCCGLGMGLVLSGATTALMFLRPTWFASLLGC